MTNVTLEEMHGKLGSQKWKAPKLVATSDQESRPG